VFFQLSSRVRSLKSLGRPFCTVTDRRGMPMLVQKWKNITCGQQQKHASTCHEEAKHRPFTSVEHLIGYCMHRARWVMHLYF
ncbi:unnamed protein product, partial [Musa hybrid cultivar]